jgi:hypothetical protein
MSVEPRARWPKHLIVPSEAQFAHHRWINFDEKKAGPLGIIAFLRRGDEL